MVQIIIFIVILILHQFLQHYWGFPLPFLDSYLDPFILGAIMPYFILWEHRLLWKKDRKFILPLWHIFTIFLILSILSELVLPAIREGYTQDIWDVLSIGVGVAWYTIFLNK